MIVGSLLLILGAVALLVLGLTWGSSVLLISSIAVSLLAAVALVVGARQAAARSGLAAPVPPAAAEAPTVPRARTQEPVAPASVADDEPGATYDDRTGAFARDRAPARDAAEPAVEPAVEPAAAPATGRAVVTEDEPEARPAAPQQRGAPDDGLAEPDPEDPADEPRAQWVAPADAARLAVTTIEVLVVDQRPRYHVAGCPFLGGRETDALPVAEAIDLGFTPCGLCRPVDRLLRTHHA